MSTGHIIRGLELSKEEIQKLRSQGLEGELLELHIHFLHIYSTYSMARGCYEIYMQIWKAKTRNKEPQVRAISYFKNFFLPVEHSLWNHTIMSIFYLVEKKPYAHSIKNYLDELEEKSHLIGPSNYVKHIVQECREHLKNRETQVLIEELTSHRGAVIGHKHYKMPNALAAMSIAPIKINTPIKLLEKLDPIIKKLHELLKGSNDIKTPLFENAAKETNQILNDLSVFLREKKY